MDKIVPNGTEVLIFNYVLNTGPKLDEEIFTRGIILSSEVLEEPSIYGDSFKMRFYKVLGEDNKIYYGTYDVANKGSHYFLSIEDHINHVRNKIISNSKTINKLNEDNIKLFDLITDLSNVIYEKNESELEPEEYLGEEAANIKFNSLDDQVTTLAKINVKRYLRNNLIKKNKTT